MSDRALGSEPTSSLPAATTAGAAREGAHASTAAARPAANPSPPDRSGRANTAARSGFSIDGRLRLPRQREHEPDRPLPVRRFWLAATCGLDRARAQPTLRGPTELLDTACSIASVRPGERRRGSTSSIYGGTLHHDRFQAAAAANNPDRALSQTGCVDANASAAAGDRADSRTRPTRRSGPTPPSKDALAGAARTVSASPCANDGDWDFPNGTRADEELPRRHAADRDAAVHAAHRRHVGRLHLRMERPADGRDSRGRRQAATSATVRTGSSRARRSAWNAIPTLRVARSDSRPRKLNRTFLLPADRSHREPAHDPEQHRHAVTAITQHSAAAPPMPGSGGIAASLRISARAPTCTQLRALPSTGGPTPSH